MFTICIHCKNGRSIFFVVSVVFHWCLLTTQCIGFIFKYVKFVLVSFKVLVAPYLWILVNLYRTYGEIKQTKCKCFTYEVIKCIHCKNGRSIFFVVSETKWNIIAACLETCGRHSTSNVIYSSIKPLITTNSVNILWHFEHSFFFFLSKSYILLGIFWLIKPVSNI